MLIQRQLRELQEAGLQAHTPPGTQEGGFLPRLHTSMAGSPIPGAGGVGPAGVTSHVTHLPPLIQHISVLPQAPLAVPDFVPPGMEAYYRNLVMAVAQARQEKQGPGSLSQENSTSLVLPHVSQQYVPQATTTFLPRKASPPRPAALIAAAMAAKQGAGDDSAVMTDMQAPAALGGMRRTQ
jgi:hypothetical protein